MTADLVVVGAGASGMMCAATAAESGMDVVLLDPNPMLGKKVRITGKGRCNVTNNSLTREVLANVPHNGKFLYSAMTAWAPADTMALFESLGCPLKTERGNRVFPVSDKSLDVILAMERYLKQGKVQLLHRAATGIAVSEGAVTGVETAQGRIDCPAAALCTGGLSYPLTGSTGDGHRFAAALGHTVTPTRPSLVPLESPAAYCGEMMGFSLRNVTLSVYEKPDGGEEKLIYRELGEMLFTHFGVSGPLILSSSAHMRDFAHCRYRLSVDLKPALDEKKLDARLLRDFQQYANREFRNALGDLAGQKMIPVLVRLSGIPPETKVNSITREQRHALLTLLKNFPVPISGPRPIDEAIVTCGGVDVREVNPRTMASKLVRGLYLAGELLDVDAYTGGYNLQIAWATGRAAGRAIRGY